MAFIYICNIKFDAAFDKNRCKASLCEPGRAIIIHQCHHKPKRDGWGTRHHPDTEAARSKAAHERYKAKRAADVRRYGTLADKLRIAELEAEVEKLQTELTRAAAAAR